MPGIRSHFVNKGTLLHYSLSVTEKIVSSIANQSSIRDRTVVDVSKNSIEKHYMFSIS